MEPDCNSKLILIKINKFGLFLTALLFLNHIQGKSDAAASSFQNVTCGSVFKLMNTAFKVRLHSHDVKYGSGSGQQSVTGSDLKEDSNSNWILKGSSVKTTCARGDAILCDGKIRLEHVDTTKNLHSHLFSSPLSSDQEVSAYGVDGEGDTGDIWQVKCPKGSNLWRRDEVVQLQHQDTGVYLSASGNTYGRPIHGHMEITGIPKADSSTYWQTMEGVFIHPNAGFGDSGSSNQLHDNAKIEL